METTTFVTTNVKPNFDVPDWVAARNQWTWSWPLHTYGFACLFFLLSFYSFLSLLNLRTVRLHARPFLSSINLALCLLGIARASYLFIDPYQANELMPPALSKAFSETAYPCVVAAFSLILLALLQITRFQVRIVFFQNAKCLSVFIVLHFATTIIIGIGSVLHDDMKYLFLVIQTIFLLWGIFICALYIYAGFRMLTVVRMMQRLRKRGNTVKNGVKTPKIKITDENDRTYSLNSEVSNPSFHTSHEDVPSRRTVLEPTYEDVYCSNANQTESCLRQAGNASSVVPSDVVFTLDGEDVDADVVEVNSGENVELGVLNRRTQQDSEIKSDVDDRCDSIYFLQCTPHGVGDRYRLHLSDGGNGNMKADRSPLLTALHATYAASVCGIALSGLYLYGLYGQFGLQARDDVHADPWPWYIFQTSCRSVYKSTEITVKFILNVDLR